MLFSMGYEVSKFAMLLSGNRKVASSMPKLRHITVVFL